MSKNKYAKPVAQQEEVTVSESNPLVETAIVAAPVTPGLALADEDYNYGEEFAGQGHKLKADEVIIPMLKIVQESSKVYKNRAADSDIELGDIYNTVTNKVYKGKDGVLLVPLRSESCVVVRKLPPEGTFIAKVSATLDEKLGGNKQVIAAFKDNGKDGWKKLQGKTANGQRVQYNYTDEVYAALLDPTDGVTPIGVVLIPFGGTNVFPRKQWWSAMAEVLTKPGQVNPTYCFRTVLKTAFRQGTAGGVDSYKYDAQPYGGSNWGRARFTAAQIPAMNACKQFLSLLDSGALGKVDYTNDPGDTEAAAEKAAF